MSRVKISTQNGPLALRKSNELVGIRTTSSGAQVPGEAVSEIGGFSMVRLAAGDVERALDAVRSREDVEVGTHVYFAEGDNRPVVPTGIIYCTLAEGVGVAESRAVFDLHNLEELERREDGTVQLSVTERSRNPIAVAAALGQLAMVASAVPDLDVPLSQYFAEPRDGLYGQQWSLSNAGYVPGVPGYPTRRGADASIPGAWKLLDGLGSPEVTVAVIDNGFDLDHPDLAGKSTSPLSVFDNSTTIPRGTSYGTHGTPCASLAVAAANGSGIVGAAPGSRFMPVHGLSYSVLYTERMFNHCIDKGAAVISCSWGTVLSRYRPGPLHERAIGGALTRGRGGLGCVVVFAAGNEGKDYLSYYARIPGVIAVGASTSNDTHPPYSNTGEGLSVVAPSDGGWPLLAARASWDAGVTSRAPEKRYYVDGKDRGPYHKHFGGTSGATPLVAGICALMLTANPSLTAAAVKSILESTAVKIGGAGEYDSSGYSRRFGYGRVDAERAVREAIRQRAGTQPPARTEPADAVYRVRAEPQAKRGYGLQVGAFGNAASALDQVAKLERQFSEPVIVAENGGLHKVILGSFADAAAARSFVPRVQSLGYRPFLRDLSTLS